VHAAAIRKADTLKDRPSKCYWAQLEKIGLGELVMAEQVRAMRALANARGGALSVRAEDKPAEPITKQLKKIMTQINACAD
jgi:hypothetical protein